MFAHMPMEFRKYGHFVALAVFGAATTLSPAQGGPPAPVKAELQTVKVTNLPQKVNTIGTLRANESVTLVAESARRLMKIHFAEGDNVTAGQLLFALDDRELQAELNEIEAKLTLARANQQRTDQLLPSKAISQLEADTATAEVKLLEAQKQTKEVQIAKTKVIAPFAGKVGVRQVSEGAFLSPATALVNLQDLSQMKVDFTLPERYAVDIKKGLAFRFTVAGSGMEHEGTISVVEPMIDAQTRSLQVRGICPKPQGLLPGGFAEVSLTLEEVKQGFLVPTQAIVPSPRGQGVYVIDAGKARLQVVEIGQRTEDHVQVLTGLREGDQIALTNLTRIRPGMDVTAATKP